MVLLAYCILVGLFTNTGQTAEIIILAIIRQGFQVFVTISDTDTNAFDFALFSKLHTLLLINNAAVRKLIACCSAVFLNQGNDAFSIALRLRNIL